MISLYQPLLAKALQRPAVVVTFAGGLLVLMAVLFPFVGKTFMPTMDEGDLIVQLESIPSVNLSSGIRMVQSVEKALLDNVEEIERIVSRSGSDEIGMDPMGLNETDVFLQLKPQDQWQVADKAALQDKMRAVLEQFPGSITALLSRLICGCRKC